MTSLTKIDFESNYNSMQLEPRLREYIDKKRFYKENNIKVHNLEQQYRITSNDIKTIKSYIRGDSKKHNNNKDMIDVSNSSFPSGDFKSDPRFERLKKKQQKHLDATTQRHNYNSISRGYDMYDNTKSYASSFGDNFDINSNKWYDESINSTINKSKNFNNTNTYTNPKSNYNSYVFKQQIIDDPYSTDAILNNINQYSSKVSQQYNNPNQYFDYNLRPVSNTTRNVDTSVDNYLRFGDDSATSRNNKAIGYPNPVEHYFSYISDDLQRPEHVVNDRGMPTRLMNKEPKSCNNKRESMPLYNLV